ncbi:xyloglucan fucosyltransferase [Marchantia polymorpha subsp. ruderalis]|uniref:Fucosyltransferase n=1 Tax=Marchantia polymorpha TaxID=3197 RepID=A0A2R6WV58_MARPO|nr:hypothetical protein MARPO_0055s0022 [Marchantia polymorpha]BBN03050.1 hypothetical protein Mp_2g20270 [Marchantia polymorpha subsp. ruderalis]|eukprot:PTQ37735.1 hypothetical protein MARPO_0055s0022 [Marchantia polymorpha]
MVLGTEKTAFSPGKHQQRGMPFWQKAVILLCVGSMLLFSLTLMMDAESASQWSGGLSALSSKLDSMAPMPVIPEDDPTCVSRTQQNLYRRQDRQLTMPTALGETWKRYAELHRSCSLGKSKNWTDVFVKQANGGCNYLLFIEGGAGLGNRILSLTSALLYALATDRVLLVDSRKILPSLLCEPFANSSWLLPDDFPYSEVEQAQALGRAKELNWNVSLVNLHLEHLQSGGDQQFFCDDTHFHLRKVPWLAWTSTQYYVTKLFMIPSFWRRLTPLFNSGPDAFTYISRLLILPNNDLWAHIVRVYWGYLSSSGLRLGLQIRLHGRGDLAAFDPAVKDRIMDCLTSNRALPTMQEGDGSNVTQLSALYPRKYLAMRRHQAPADTVVFIASLQQRYQEELMKMFDRQANVDNSIIRVHMVSHSGRQDNSVDQSHNALVEMWLLSFSDVIATSAYSTFGYIAQGLGGLTPYILNIRGENVTGDGKASCLVGQSSQPCTHYPMKPACESLNITESHQAWMDGHIRECQDQPGGLQLGTYPVPLEGR